MLVAMPGVKPGWELVETVISPKATPLDGLFGSYAPASQTWHDGVFTAALRDAWRASRSWHWIVLDGPVDPIWMEDLNTLLDDSRFSSTRPSPRTAITFA
jgi:hypothetical protein